MILNTKEAHLISTLLEKYGHEFQEHFAYQSLMDKFDFYKDYHRNEFELFSKPIELEVQYIGESGYFDGVSFGKIYPAIEILETQYKIINDHLDISILNKEKFRVVKEGL